MSDMNKKLRIFIGSPGDVADERDIVSLVVGELRRGFEEILPFQLETVKWETHAWPDIGEDAQDVINREIGEFDIFVGIMWRRFGTPTKRARSGTDEEFQRAYQYFKKYHRPRVMFYFRRAPFYTTNLNELSQFRKVVQFRKELEKLGVLFWEYERPIDFERNVREHLIRQVLPMCTAGVVSGTPPSHTKPHLPSRAAKLLDKLDSYASRKPLVFLAYSRADSERVAKLYEDLRIAGFNPWLDTENMVPGQMWHSVVEDTIKRADAIILCLSYNSMTTKQGYFQNEIKAAMDQVKLRRENTPLVITVRFANVPLPIGIGNVQFLDYFQPGGPERLVEVLKALTRKEAPNKAMHTDGPSARR